ncbi:DUF6318 family protein [Lapillicoccus sp.]|uniref:DUF6318 family protein n=1 Tax=Lapillicoccus sp. TaxID=1909287 RepID=UPI0025E6FB6E|nr:DUF6318 family protein [Lapillicoccus sp.]
MAARANTAAGAEAFTRYFLGQTNASYKQLRPELIEPLVASGCKTCAGFISQVKEYISKRQKYEGDFVTPTLVTVSSFSGTVAKVFVSSDTAAGRVVESDGTTAQELPAEKGNTTTALMYSDGAWTVAEIQAVA